MAHPTISKAPDHRKARSSFRPQTSERPGREGIAVRSPSTTTPTVARPRVTKQLRRTKAQIRPAVPSLRTEKKLTRELPHPAPRREKIKYDYSDAYSTLQPFESKDGTIDIAEAFASDINRGKLESAINSLWPDKSSSIIERGIFYGNISKKDPLDVGDWVRLSVKERETYYPLVGLTSTAWVKKEIELRQAGMAPVDIDWELKGYYIKPEAISPELYKKFVGPGKEKYYPDPHLSSNVFIRSSAQLTDVMASTADKLHGYSAQVPGPAFIGHAGRFASGLAIGALVEAPMMAANLFVLSGALGAEFSRGAGWGAKPFWAVNWKDALKGGTKASKGFAAATAIGMASWFTTIPDRYSKDPAYTTGNLIGLFIIGPGKAIKSGIRLAHLADPYYLPSRAVRFEFSTPKIVKAYKGKITPETYQKLVREINEGVEWCIKNPGKDYVGVFQELGNAQFKLKLKSTPISKVLGPHFAHASAKEAFLGEKGKVIEIPHIGKAIKELEIKGEMFWSPHVAIRFAFQSAVGKVHNYPAVGLVFTKKGLRYARGPKSTELEVVYKDTAFPRVTTFRNWLFGPRAGSFYLIEEAPTGLLRHVPVYLFKEKGAKAPRIGLAELAAIRFYTLWDLMKDILVLEPIRGARGSHGGTRGAFIWKERAPLGDIVKQWHQAALRKARRYKDETKQKVVYEAEINRLMETNLRRIYKPNASYLERMFAREGVRSYLGYRHRYYFRKHVDRATRMSGRPSIRGPRTTERIFNLNERPRIRQGTQEGFQPRVPDERRVGEHRVPSYRGVTPSVVPPKELPPPTPPRMGLLKGELKEAKRKKFPMGSFTWRQGFVWWTIVPPYRGRKDMTPSINPPPGVTVVKGPRSAYKTIQKLGVNVPQAVLLDLGIMDIKISKHGKKISYKRDIKQRTKLGYAEGMPAGVAKVSRR